MSLKNVAKEMKPTQFPVRTTEETISLNCSMMNLGLMYTVIFEWRIKSHEHHNLMNHILSYCPPIQLGSCPCFKFTVVSKKKKQNTKTINTQFNKYVLKVKCVNAVLYVVTWSCPTLCDPMDRNLPGSSVRGIFQARILEWVAISYSNYVA